MKKLLFTLLILALASVSYADSILFDSFEYANHDGETPIGWVCNDNSWKAGYLEKDHNRIAHEGNWYAYTEGEDSWLFMELYMTNELKYRYSFWAISDGEYDVEIWAGSGPTSAQMTHQLCTMTVSGGEYDFYTEYIQSIPSDFQFFGIRAIAHDDAYCLTIDDINVDMVVRYAMFVNPDRSQMLLAPGAQAEFEFVFTNSGYEPLQVYITHRSDYFTDVHLSIDGTVCTDFHADPGESITLTGVATLLPNIEVGSWCWVDIMFDIDCACASAMYAFWAEAGYESLNECSASAMSIYPNPSKGALTIVGNGLVTITNALGQEVYRKQVVDNELVRLPKGVYFVRKDDGHATKIIVE